MPAYRDDSAGKWYVQCYYKDAAGHNRHKVKRGFPTELEAMLWEKELLSDKESAMGMEFRKYRYAHLFPTKQQDMANALYREKEN